MALPVLSLVLLAALIHALWNAWLKGSGDRLTLAAIMAFGWALVGFAAMALAGMPDSAAWPFLAASTVVHTGYWLALLAAYRVADLSVAYPVARGTGPLLVTVISALFLGEALGAVGFAAVILIAAGVIGLSRSLADRRALLFSLLTGLFIAAYTLIDGFGGRAGGAHAYIAWLLVLTAIPIPLIALAVHGKHLGTLARPAWWRGLGAGIVSGAAYWIVVWAMSHAPVGLVASVRESGVAFAALLGGYALREPVRWIPVLMVFAGVVLARLAQ